MRIAILLESDRQLAAHELLADALCRRGHAVHLAVQGETVKDRDGALGRLSAAHASLTVGQAPFRQDRWSSLLKELRDRLDPVADVEGEDDDPRARGGDGVGALALARLALAAMPLDPDVATYLGQLDLDLLLLAPRASPWSAGLDYLLTCRRLGVRAAPLGASPLAPLFAPQAAAIPFGIDQEGVAPDEIAAAVERSGSTPVQPRQVSWISRLPLELVFGFRALKGFAEDRLGADVQHGLIVGLLRRVVGLVQNAYARWIFPNVMRALVALLPRRRDLLRGLLDEQLDPSEMSRLGWAEDAIAAALRGGAPILLGPWVGGVGHEVLYWAPMLRWLRKYYRIDKSRIVVISRGGTKSLYAGILGHYLDVFDLVPNKRQQYRDEALQRINSSDAPSPAGKIEKEIYKEAARLIGAERYNTLHPQVMFKLFKRRWTGLAGDTFLARYTRIQSIAPDLSAARKRLGEMPADYVAVNFYFSQELPDTPRNRALVEGFIRRLSEAVDVFLIEPHLDAQGGPTGGIGPTPRIHRIPLEVRPSEILGVQSGVIGGARALVGTFGGMTYLGQALGRTAIGVKAGDGAVSEGATELSMIRPDPAGGQIHIVELEQIDQLIPPLTPGRRGGGAEVAATVSALQAAGDLRGRDRPPA